MTLPLRPLAALALALLLAPAAARAAELKLGYVDLDRAIEEVDEGKAAKAQLKKDFDEKQKRLDEKQDEFKKLKADFDKQAMVMSEAARKEKGAELEKRFLDLQQFAMQLQKDLSERERAATAALFDKMAVVVKEIAEAEGFTMIFERRGAGLIYAPVSLDVTNELIRKYNGRHGAGAAKKADPPKK
jgi:outer membrane protein